MEQEESADLPDESSVQEQRKMKPSKTVNALLIGFLLGVAIYSAVNNGFSFWTLFPLLIAFVAFGKGKKSKP